MRVVIAVPSAVARFTSALPKAICLGDLTKRLGPDLLMQFASLKVDELRCHSGPSWMQEERLSTVRCTLREPQEVRI